jgi:hypothetical protein
MGVLAGIELQIAGCILGTFLQVQSAAGSATIPGEDVVREGNPRPPPLAKSTRPVMPVVIWLPWEVCSMMMGWLVCSVRGVLWDLQRADVVGAPSYHHTY